MTRVLAVAGLAAALYVLMQINVTVPALSLLALFAWAVVSSALAIGYARRSNRRPEGTDRA